LGDIKNSRVLSAFPDHQPFYFRPKIPSIDNPDPLTIYGFYPERDRSDRWKISFFELSAAIQYSHTFTDLDAFDVTYPRLFYAIPGDSQLAYVDQQAKLRSVDGDVQTNFRQGLIHTARMLLLPRIAYEKGGFDRWPAFIDLDKFRLELQSAIDSFQKSGTIGSEFLPDLNKVKLRIDENRNGELSDTEVIRFLQEKILLFAEFV
jgi:hypothetical protein